MLRPRARAAGGFSAALAQGRSRVLGTDGVVEITEARWANVKSAERLITVARETEGQFIAEPDDTRL
jgi:tRNA/tmRNA/rRNA uracil-C5-methylase (TrmA/RlmC/RlmD family)